MKKALIVYGGWDGHQPEACASLFRERLMPVGIDAELQPTLQPFDSPEGLAPYDLIIPLWTMGSITKEQEKVLVDAVRRGKGIAGFHGGMCDAFRGAITYQWMTGGQFVAHPDGIKEHVVKIVSPSDPIVEGITDFKVTTEQYYMLVDPANDVLATTTHASASMPWCNGVIMPYCWKKFHGAGRVFYSALGHQARDFVDVPPQLEITLRGMRWAAGLL
jgi:uncharacterized protein